MTGEEHETLIETILILAPEDYQKVIDYALHLQDERKKKKEGQKND